LKPLIVGTLIGAIGGFSWCQFCCHKSNGTPNVA
jgi:hypothetical protein